MDDQHSIGAAVPAMYWGSHWCSTSWSSRTRRIVANAWTVSGSRHLTDRRPPQLQIARVPVTEPDTLNVSGGSDGLAHLPARPAHQPETPAANSPPERLENRGAVGNDPTLDEVRPASNYPYGRRTKPPNPPQPAKQSREGERDHNAPGAGAGSTSRRGAGLPEREPLTTSRHRD
jgi:hypothetical protein